MTVGPPTWRARIVKVTVKRFSRSYARSMFTEILAGDHCERPDAWNKQQSVHGDLEAAVWLPLFRSQASPNGSGRGSRRAPPSLAPPGRWQMCTAAFGPTRGELAAHLGTLSTGRTVPLPVDSLHPVASPRRWSAAESRRSPAPTSWTWSGHRRVRGATRYAIGQSALRRRRSKAAHGKGPIDGTRRLPARVNRCRPSMFRGTACRPRRVPAGLRDLPIDSQSPSDDTVSVV